MTAQTLELVEVTVEAEDDRPDIAHVYCAVCSQGREVAVSVCGSGRKPTVELGLEWPAGSQRCAVCLDLMMLACPGCGS